MEYHDETKWDGTYCWREAQHREADIKNLSYYIVIPPNNVWFKYQRKGSDTSLQEQGQGNFQTFICVKKEWKNRQAGQKPSLTKGWQNTSAVRLTLYLYTAG